jgi:hypothetical protein
LIKKYVILNIIFLLIAVNASSTLSLKTDSTQNGIAYQDENLDICIGTVKEGKGLTVEISNNGNVDAENIELNVNVDSGKMIFISKKNYEIPFLAAGDSTEIPIKVFGCGLGIFFDYPLINLAINSSDIDSGWKKIVTRVIGTNTKILTEISGSAEPYKGYTLFGPEYSKYTYLIDNYGKIRHIWKSNYIQGLANYLLEDGSLLRLDLPFNNPVFFSGGVAGRAEKFDKNSNLLWEFEYCTSDYCAHHDIEPLPNGNILLIAWEYKTRQEAIDAGLNPDILHGNSLWPDHIIEVKPNGSSGGDIVWEWHVWDHLIQDYDVSKANYDVVEDHPELVDINYVTTPGSDWMHTNSIDYNEEFNQILISVHNFNEIWVIDHSTTTEEAAGHTGGNSGKGGDLLYRWGNPQAYRAGDADDQQYFSQHGANWIEEDCPGAGNILVFNNGDMGRRYSSVDEIVPPIDSNGNYEYTSGTAYGPVKPIWVYTAENPADLFSMTLSNAQRLPNGNTLLCSANQGLFLEVTFEKEIVWKYQNILPTPFTNTVARIYRYPLDYPGSSDFPWNEDRSPSKEIIIPFDTSLEIVKFNQSTLH